MITLNIVERKTKNKVTHISRSTKVFNSTDLARKFIKPVVREMRDAEKQKREPSIAIEGVSYDTDSEKRMLAELGAVHLTEYESDFN